MLGWIGLGSNLGDSPALLRSALKALMCLPDSELRAVSPFYRSAALQLAGDTAKHPDYCNAVVSLQTRLTPHALLKHLLRIEIEHGRDRSVEDRWQPRSLDLDLLALGQQCCDSNGLRLPHPQWRQRNFVLQPWVDIAAATLVPGQGSVATAWSQLDVSALQSWAQPIHLS